MQKWKQISQSENYVTKSEIIRKVLIGITLLFLLMCLISCKSDTIVVEKIKLDCINSMQTNGQMAECLAKYDEM